MYAFAHAPGNLRPEALILICGSKAARTINVMHSGSQNRIPRRPAVAASSSGLQPRLCLYRSFASNWRAGPSLATGDCAGDSFDNLHRLGDSEDDADKDPIIRPPPSSTASQQQQWLRMLSATGSDADDEAHLTGCFTLSIPGSINTCSAALAHLPLDRWARSLTVNESGAKSGAKSGAEPETESRTSTLDVRGKLNRGDQLGQLADFCASQAPLHKITSVSLADNSLLPSDLPAIARLAAACPDLQALDLSNNARLLAGTISSEQATALTHLLRFKGCRTESAKRCPIVHATAPVAGDSSRATRAQACQQQVLHSVHNKDTVHNNAASPGSEGRGYHAQVVALGGCRIDAPAASILARALLPKAGQEQGAGPATASEGADAASCAASHLSAASRSGGRSTCTGVAASTVGSLQLCLNDAQITGAAFEALLARPSPDIGLGAGLGCLRVLQLARVPSVGPALPLLAAFLAENTSLEILDVSSVGANLRWLVVCVARLYMCSQVVPFRSGMTSRCTDALRRLVSTPR